MERANKRKKRDLGAALLSSVNLGKTYHKVMLRSSAMDPVRPWISGTADGSGRKYRSNRAHPPVERSFADHPSEPPPSGLQIGKWSF